MPTLTEDDVYRFLLRIHKHEGCWLWKGCVDTPDTTGYGLLSLNGKTEKAHRVSYLIHKGDPGELHVLHTCDTPRCVNPEHLYLGTDLDNMKDRQERTGYHALIGSSNPNALLDEKKVATIKKRLIGGIHYKNIAREFGVTVACITYIKQGKTWKHVQPES